MSVDALDGVVPLTAADITWDFREGSQQSPIPTDDEDLVVAVICEAQAYRLLAQQAIHALHDQYRAHVRLRGTHARTLEEYRSLRERVLRDAGAIA